MTRARLLSYDCALEGRARPPITVAILDEPTPRTYTVRLYGRSRRPHHFQVSVSESGEVDVLVYVPWERAGFSRRVRVGTAARVH